VRPKQLDAGLVLKRYGWKSHSFKIAQSRKRIVQSKEMDPATNWKLVIVIAGETVERIDLALRLFVSPSASALWHPAAFTAGLLSSFLILAPSPVGRATGHLLDSHEE
jgi:hypothetical protein